MPGDETTPGVGVCWAHSASISSHSSLIESLLDYACILVPHTWDRLIKAVKMFGRVWREGRGILSVASFPCPGNEAVLSVTLCCSATTAHPLDHPIAVLCV